MIQTERRYGRFYPYTATLEAKTTVLTAPLPDPLNAWVDNSNFYEWQRRPGQPSMTTRSARPARGWWIQNSPQSRSVAAFRASA